MTLSPHPHHADLHASWARFHHVTTRLADTRLASEPGADDDDDDFGDEDLVVFGEFLLARDELFRRLALPVTAHNSLRLYDFAEAGLSLERFLDDVDVHFPRALMADEGLFLSALATYCGWRVIEDVEGRVYDAEAFLGVPHHPHNAAVVGAWLRGELDWLTTRVHLSKDEDFLAVAVA